MASLQGVMKSQLHAVVDMGSNGIRFSISDLSAPTARIMPTVFQDRAGISLYDAQFSTADGARGPIPATVIEQVVARLLRFKTTCEDFEVPEQNIHILATEATRTAPNYAEFISTIEHRTGWQTRILSKEEEGRVGALGVASSFASVEGLVMDLGGGSTQITWMVARDGIVTTSPTGSVSFPYGAAALLRRLEEVHRKGVRAAENLEEEMRSNIRNAYKSLLVPETLEKAAASRGGFDLYLSGGGFRGWGYLLMSQSSLNPYPIPIINGFRVNWAEFTDTAAVSQSVSQGDTEIFRVSKRRASQVRAVAFLVKVVSEALPPIRSIQFCQGGVREGFLYDQLGEDIRKQDPLLVATAAYAPPSAKSFFDLLKSALPATMSPIISRQIPSSFTDTLLFALANLCYAHAFIPRETRPASGLYSTTTGILAAANSLAHKDRAILALILRERWPGDLAPAEQSFQSRLLRFLSPQEAWWCQYLGRVATLLGNVYPAGRVSNDDWRIRFNTGWQQVFKKNQGTTDALHLNVVVNEAADQAVSRDSLQDAVERIEKLGKRKNWVKLENHLGPERIEDDYGVNIEVTVSSDAGI